MIIYQLLHEDIVMSLMCTTRDYLIVKKFLIRQFIELNTLRTSLPSDLCDLCAALDPYSSLDDKKSTGINKLIFPQ